MKRVQHWVGNCPHNLSRQWEYLGDGDAFQHTNDFTAPAFLSLKQSAMGIAIGVDITTIVIFLTVLGKGRPGGLMYMNGNYTPFGW